MTGKIRHRVRAAVAAGIGLGLLVSGCATGGLPQQSGGQAAALDGQVSGDLSGKVTIWSWDVAADALKRLEGAFEEKHPKVDIQVIDVGYDNAYNKLSVGLQAGSGLPDIVTVESARLPSYTENFPQAFVDLTARAKKYKDDFPKAKWASSSDERGHLYSVPWDMGTVGLFYRRDYFQAAGVSPQSVDTWQDLIAAGVKIKEATGKKLFAMDVTNGDSIFQMMLQQQGQMFVNTQGKVALTSSAATRALTVLDTMSEERLVENVKGWNGLVTATKEGEVATAPIGVWWAGTLTSQMPELSGKWGVLPLPAFRSGSTRTSNNGGSTLAIPTQSDNRDAAWAFIQFALANKSSQASMMREEALFPAYLPALENSFFHERQSYFGDQKAYELFVEKTPEVPVVNYTEDYAKATDLVHNAVASVMLGGTPAEAALQDAAQQFANATGRSIASRRP